MSGFLGMMFLGASGGAAPVVPSEFLSISGNFSSPANVTVYPWNSTSGFSTPYTTPTIPGASFQTSFVPDNSVFSASSTSSPYFYVWQWSGLGFGTRYTNPASLVSPVGGSGIAGFTWTPTIDAFLVANSDATNYPQGWAWSNTSGFGTKYSNGSAISTVYPVRSISISGDGNFVAFSVFGSGTANPTIALYAWSSSTGFGTKYGNPSTLPSGAPPVRLGMAFNKVTNDLATSEANNQIIDAYPVTSSGFGTRYADPVTGIGGIIRGVKFSSDGALLAIATGAATPISVYNWGAGFGTKYSGSPVASSATSIDWSSTNISIVIGNQVSSPYNSVYSWSGGYGSKFANPSTAPGASQGVSFGNQSR